MRKKWGISQVGLNSLAEKHETIKEVRGLGLIIGVELDVPGAPVVEACRQNGFLIVCAQERVLRLVPPLIVGKKRLIYCWKRSTTYWMRWRRNVAEKIKKIVLAYSGGLDTSVILKWLKETYQCPVVAYAADLGQGEELDGIREKLSPPGPTKW